MGLQAGYLIGGSILIETVFTWPGTGFLLNSAIFRRDLPVLQGTTLVLAASSCCSTSRGRDPDHGRSAHQARLTPWPSRARRCELDAARSCSRSRPRPGAATGSRSARRLRHDPVTLVLRRRSCSCSCCRRSPRPWLAPGRSLQDHRCCAGSSRSGSPGHLLGTDELGRDMLSRLIYGGRLSLLMGVMPVLCALLIGGTLGHRSPASSAAASTRRSCAPWTCSTPSRRCCWRSRSVGRAWARGIGNGCSR